MLRRELQQALARVLHNKDEDRQLQTLEEMYPRPAVPADDMVRCASLDVETSFSILHDERLAALDSDGFALSERLGKRPMSSLACYLITRRGLVDALGLDPRKMYTFFRILEDGYGENPYHNRVHAMDVLQRVHAITQPAGLQPEEQLAVYTAAAAHDFGHPGLTNSFLVATRNLLADRYHNRSPMENFHVFGTLQLLRQEQTAFMPGAVLQAVTGAIIDLILATDISNHVQVMRVPLDERDQPLWRLKVCLKCADVSHAAAPAAVHRRWSALLMEELRRQQQLEEAAGLPLTLPAVTARQVDFFDYIVIPMLTTLEELFPHTAAMRRAAEANRQLYVPQST